MKKIFKSFFRDKTKIQDKNYTDFIIPKIEKFRATKTVTIKQNEHANLDSFTLRYGFQFESNTELEIHYDPSTLCPDKNPKYSDRYNVIVKFLKQKILFHFYIMVISEI